MPGSLPAPASAGNLPIAEAASLDGITAQAVLVSGHWPGAPAAGRPGGVIPAALPAAAAALLHVTDGDVLRLKDRVSVGMSGSWSLACTGPGRCPRRTGA